MESEIKRTRKTLKNLEKMALDWRAWKDVVVDLCLRGPKGEEEGQLMCCLRYDRSNMEGCRC
jgi:hypothetical protein